MLVSVIVPVYNAENKIIILLNALNHQRYDGNFEVILVDDDSTDNSRGVIKTYISQNITKFDISLVEIEHQGPAVARNTGAARANGDILIFTDSDCVPVDGWLNAMTEPFNDPSVSGVGGTYKTENPKSLIARYIGYDIEFRHSKFEKDIDFVGSYSMGFRKDVFFKAGMFPSEYKEANAEDNELSYRVIDLGERIVYAPNAIVSHKHPDTLKKLTKQQIKRAIWRVLLMRRNKKHITDKYANISTLIQPLIWVIFPIFWLVFFLLHQYFLPLFSPLTTGDLISMSIIVFAMGLVLIFYLLNKKTLSWIKVEKKEPLKIRVLFFFIIIFRSFCWFLGGIAGVFKYFLSKKTPKSR